MSREQPIPQPYQKRIQTLRNKLEKKALSGIFISQPENRRYLSGFKPADPQLNESSGFLIIGSGLAILGTDPRYEEEARRQAKGFYPFIYRKGLETSWPEMQNALKDMKKLGFESQSITFSLFRRLKNLVRSKGSPLTLVPTHLFVEELRAVKDRREIAAIQRSLSITEQAFQEVCRSLRPGRTEKEIAWQIKNVLHQKGGEDVAFEPIVASGPNSALPHAEPSERRIRKGEPLLFDLGCKWKGYCSDLSRTIFLGHPTDRFKEVYALVRKAQLRALKGIRAGLTTVQADDLARSVIEKGGYGKYFKHSLGHGVGLATHESPSLSLVKAESLSAGMVVTVEPGIYLPRWGGIRLENMVVINKNGARSLNKDMTFYDY
jgi:Xaa-Pro aminopeptidase